MKRAALLIALVLGSPLGAAQAGAAEVGGRVIVAADVPGLSTGPVSASAAYDETLDRHLVTWLQVGAPLGSTTNAWGRFLTSDGEATGAPFLAATVGTGIEGREARDVQAVYDPVRREYLLLIAGLRNASFADDFELYAQWLDDQGERIGDAIAVSRVSAGTIARPTVAADPANDRFIVAYEVDRPSLAGRTIAVQEIRRGTIGAPRYPFGEVPAIRPAITVGGDGVLVAGMTGAAGSALTVRRLSTALDPVGGAASLTLAGPLTAGPSLRWHPQRDGAAVAWSEVSGPRLAVVDRNGALGPVTAIPGDLSLVAIELHPLARDARWLVLARGAAGSPLTATELALDGGVESTVVVSGGEPAPFGPLLAEERIGASVDRTRTWALVPYGIRTADRRALLARVAAASPARAPAPPPPPAAPAAARCTAGATLFLPRTGSACGPTPVAAFTVAPITNRRRTALLGLAIRPTVKGHRVRVECVRRCGRLRPVLSARSKRAATDLMLGTWRVPRQATFEVRVERTEATTRFRQFTLRQRFPFLRATAAQGCRLPTGVEAPC